MPDSTSSQAAKTLAHERQDSPSRPDPAWVKLMVFHGRWRSRAIYARPRWLRRLYRFSYDLTFRPVERLTLKLQARAWQAEKETP